MKTRLLHFALLGSLMAYSPILAAQWKVVNWSQAISRFEMLSPELGYYLAEGLVCKTTDGGATWLAVGQLDAQAFDFTDPETGWIVGGSVLAKTYDGGASWQPQIAPGATGLRDIFMQDANTGWVCGYDAEFYRTTNGGATWQPINLGIIENLADVYFYDAQTGWVVGDEGVAFRTVDGGATWLPMTLTSGDDLERIFFSSAQTGWLFPYFSVGDVFHTTDGGASWDPVNLFSFTIALQSGYFFDQNNGWLCGGGTSPEQGKLLRTVNGGQSWTPTTFTVASEISGLSFLDADLGWGMGGNPSNNSAIIKTTDGGMNWQEKKSLDNSPLYAVAYAGDDTWYAADIDAEIYKSTDDGETWVLQAMNNWHYPNAIDFVDPATGWVVVNQNRLLKTTDGGTSWTAQVTPSSNSGQLNSCSFVDANVGWTVGYPDKVFKTTDGGATWINQAPAPGTSPKNYFDVFFINATTGWAVGEYGVVQRTTNGGATWISSDLDYDLVSVYFINPSTGWTVGDAGTIRKTINGGVTWTSQTAPVVDDWTSVFFADAFTGWISSNNTVLVTHNGGQTWMLLHNQLPNLLDMTGDADGNVVLVGSEALILKNLYPYSVGLSQEPISANTTSGLRAYPNPLTDQLNVQLDNSPGGQLMIVNLLGHPVLRGALAPGTTTFDVSGWPAGIYFLHFAGASADNWQGIFLKPGH